MEGWIQFPGTGLGKSLFGFLHTLFFLTIWNSLFLFLFIFISWRLITLHYCSGFCHTLTWTSHGFTCVPHPDPPSHLPVHPIALGHPSAPASSTCLMHQPHTLLQENPNELFGKANISLFIVFMGIWSHHFKANRWGKKWKQWQILFSWAPKSLWRVTATQK